MAILVPPLGHVAQLATHYKVHTMTSSAKAVKTVKAPKTATKATAAAPAPVVAAPPASVAPAASSAALYVIAAPGLASLARLGLLTLQRSAKGHGAQWRAAGIKGENLRAGALAAIHTAAGDQPFTLAQAIKALDGINLGSKTPATRVSAFIRSGLIAPAPRA